MHPRKPLDIMGLLCSLAAPWSAAAGDPLLGANTAAMGGAAAAHPRDTSALNVNPGALALTERYDIQGHALAGDGALEGAGAAVDSRTSILALGASYRRQLTHPDYRPEELPGWVAEGVLPPNRKRYHDVVVGAAVPIWDRHLSFGVSGTFSRYEHDRLGSGFSGNLDAGLAARASESLTFGLAVHDPLPISNQADRPFSALAGARFDHEERFVAALDVGYAFEDTLGSPLIVRGGAEVAVQLARFRAGYRYEGPTDAQRITWGIGFESVEGSFEYAMEVPVGTHFELGALIHRVGIRLFLPPAGASPL